MITDEQAKALIKEMFEDGCLDPYPSSDQSPEVALREWCGYVGEPDELDEEDEG
jgi:hypothetical protein